jgi:hypothetical protein
MGTHEMGGFITPLVKNQAAAKIEAKHQRRQRFYSFMAHRTKAKGILNFINILYTE